MKPNLTQDPDSVVCGRNAVNELLKSGRPVDKLFLQRGYEGSLTVLAAEAFRLNIPVTEVDRRALDVYGSNHQGVVALIPEREYASLDDLFANAEAKGEKPFFLIADHLNDPHNLGAIIRSAECAGAHGVIIPKRNSATLNATAVKASAGAAEHLPVCRVPNLAAAVEELQQRGVWVYAAEANGQPYRRLRYDDSGIAFVLGSEGNGVSRLITEKADFVVSIPMFGAINSLNVSAAAAILLFEAASQRHSAAGE